MAHPTYGTLRINAHLLDRAGLFVHLVAKYQGEAASTVVDSPRAETDVEAPHPPPANRSYKNADLFSLIKGNHLVVCTDGARVSALEYYLKHFLVTAGQSNNSVLFAIKHVQNVDTVAVLQRGGVQEIKLTGTLYSATVDNIQNSAAMQMWSMPGVMRNFQDHLAAVFGKDDDAEIEDNSDQLQVEVTVKARGGTRANGAVLRKMEDVGLGVIEESDGISYEIKSKNKTITAQEMVVFDPVVLLRGEQSNSLQRTEVFDKLVQAMEKFEREGHFEL